MTREESPSEKLLAMYHDLWDMKLRATELNRSFLVYLLEVALEDVHQELAKHPRAKHSDPPGQ